jgi:mono/diheme cytochrome c family protein
MVRTRHIMAGALAALVISCSPSHRVPPGAAFLQKPLTADWASLTSSIFQPRCRPCHNPEGQARFLDLSTRESLLAERHRLFDFDNPDLSYLIQVVRDPVEPMPPLNSSLRKLSEEEVAVLVEWIAQGLP